MATANAFAAAIALAAAIPFASLHWTREPWQRWRLLQIRLRFQWNYTFLEVCQICFQLLYMSIIIQQRILQYKIQGSILLLMRANGICHPLWTNVRHFSNELWCIISLCDYCALPSGQWKL